MSPGYLPKETKNTNAKIYTPPHVYCSIIYNSQDMEATQVSVDEGMDKEAVVDIQTSLHYKKKKKKGRDAAFGQHEWT